MQEVKIFNASHNNLNLKNNIQDVLCVYGHHSYVECLYSSLNMIEYESLIYERIKQT